MVKQLTWKRDSIEKWERVVIIAFMAWMCVVCPRR